MTLDIRLPVLGKTEFPLYGRNPRWYEIDGLADFHKACQGDG